MPFPLSNDVQSFHEIVELSSKLLSLVNQGWLINSGIEIQSSGIHLSIHQIKSLHSGVKGIGKVNSARRIAQ